jgi:hypothetical protein
MILMAVVSLGLIVGMPYLMDNRESHIQDLSCTY